MTVLGHPGMRLVPTGELDAEGRALRRLEAAGGADEDGRDGVDTVLQRGAGQAAREEVPRDPLVRGGLPDLAALKARAVERERDVLDAADRLCERFELGEVRCPELAELADAVARCRAAIVAHDEGFRTALAVIAERGRVRWGLQ